ncbi:MAG: polysaccharide deacetylase family protein [Candidatus Kryptoniota bacterium]
MKVLHISPFSPVPPTFGGALRVYYILRGLARSHEVTFVTFGTERERVLLNKEFGGMVQQIHVVDNKSLASKHTWLRVLLAFWKGQSFLTTRVTSHHMQETLDRLLKKENYDLIILEFPLMGKLTLAKNVTKILDEHNIEYSNLHRMYKGIKSLPRKFLYFREHHKMFVQEIDTCNMVDAIFVTSQNDRAILREQLKEKPIYVVPNGVDTDYFKPSDETTEPYSMVFTGTMDYLPNHDGMVYFLDDIFPLIKRTLPEVKIYVVGKNPPPDLKRRASPDIIVTGSVEDVRPYAWKASVYVVPLRMGSGTRLKILEGLAMKKAIVTTSIGCEGIEVKDGENVLIANNAVLFAEKVVDLLLDNEKARRLGTKGYELVTSKYKWDVITSSMNQTIASVISEKKRVAMAQAAANSVEIKNERLPAAIHPSRSLPHPASTKTKTPAGIRSEINPAIKVLMYHRIVDDKDSHEDYSWLVTTHQFRRHLELLDRWGYTCINFEDHSLFLEGKITLPKKPVIITFDDGYEEVYKYALPITKEFGVRATAFVLGDRSIRNNAWENTTFESSDLLSDDQILELHRSGFEIGSHSMTHADLSKISRGAARDEICRSKEHLEDLIQAPVITFAYPYGNVNTDLKDMVRDAGYNYGCGTYSGSPKFTHDLYNIRRIAVTSRKANAVNFGLNLLTFHEYYTWIKWDAKQKMYKLTPRSAANSDGKKSGHSLEKDAKANLFKKETEHR